MASRARSRRRELDALLLGGGDLTWAAGPLAKGPGFCHGTAGNGYAFLQAVQAHGRKRPAQAVTAPAPSRCTPRSRNALAVRDGRHGQGRYALWTGDLGTAMYLRHCLDGSCARPAIELW